MDGKGSGEDVTLEEHSQEHGDEEAEKGQCERCQDGGDARLHGLRRRKGRAGGLCEAGLQRRDEPRDA